MERRALIRRLAIVAVPVLAVVLAAAFLLRDDAPGTVTEPLRPVTEVIAVRAPDDVRVRVAVLNATSRRGLARTTAFMLRDLGFDVVEIDNAAEQRDSTLVLSHTGHLDWAQLVGQAMGGATVEARPDSSRYLDVTVLIGDSWTPPREAFYP